MDKMQVIEKLLDRSMQSLFEMSANYAMTIPRKGCESGFAEEQEIIDVLSDMKEECQNEDKL